MSRTTIDPQDVVGKKFDMLTVLEYVCRTNYRVYKYLCRCDCGVEKTVTRSTLLNSARFHSCGCQQLKYLIPGSSELCSRAGTARAKLNPDGVNKAIIFRSGTICTNTSGIQGVSYSKTANKWHVYVGYKCYRCNLGFLENLEDAKALHELALNHIASNTFEEFFYDLRGFKIEDKLIQIKGGRKKGE
jgi:hypothetical protein